MEYSIVKNDKEEEKGEPAALRFKGKDLLYENGSKLHLNPLAELVGSICLSFRDVCRFSKAVGYDDQRNEAFFEDARGPTTSERSKNAVWDYLGKYVHDELLVEFKIPAKIVASALLAIYDQMAVEYEEKRQPIKGNTILMQNADTTAVLLLEKVDGRQYFFVPGGFSPKVPAKCFALWRKQEKNEALKNLTERRLVRIII